ncbi:flagellum-specific ATP synthase [Thermodesulfovibrio aggregans]|uniref:Flagellum-specific ATP synthase n=1 Tax=Thermodesulfovibrio aggregans TaxID=86166 RepID=A0A0U9HN59_9BACT|nr:FliI/YscN family ATPase [Thermodesulfovibrio aggregans]GAQ94443.1 flagellum-specific ATP synthase [Thermodesulfovibrio aggregans]
MLSIQSFLNEAEKVLEQTNPVKIYGKVTKAVGLIVESVGITASIGDICEIITDENTVEAEVVGFKNGTVLLSPLGEIYGIRTGARIAVKGKQSYIPISNEILGRIIDGTGNPIDGREPLRGKPFPIYREALNPLEREIIKEPLDLGIRAINSLITCGKGQKIGIMAGSGVGKSVLLGMIAKYTAADVNVIALIGERGREVREFIENDLGEEGLKKSVVVVSTSDTPALARIRGAFLATAIAEYFREKGKDVLLLMDSLTRFAMAQREIGLAAGEPPTMKGYPPSVFNLMPKLLERVGVTKNGGSITGIYTVLVEGDDLTDPVADAARSILDGHIVLSRELANRNHYPAIDILKSISRLMKDIIDEKHLKYSQRLLEVLATYARYEDIISIGAYKEGTNPQVDYAIKMIDKINNFLRQDLNEKVSFQESLDQLYSLFE